MAFSQADILEEFVSSAHSARARRISADAWLYKRMLELRQANREYQQVWRMNPANREKKRVYMQERYRRDPEVKKRLLARQKSPEYRAKHNLANQRYRSSKKGKVMVKAMQRRMWKTPDGLGKTIRPGREMAIVAGMLMGIPWTKLEAVHSCSSKTIYMLAKRHGITNRYRHR